MNFLLFPKFHNNILKYDWKMKMKNIYLKINKILICFIFSNNFKTIVHEVQIIKPDL